MLIEMLHSCDAGEKSVLTYYPGDFALVDHKDGYSNFSYKVYMMNAMRWY